MAWQRLPLTFELKSPLHIGFLPNQPGTVIARTRCYVPGKNLWGAVVANLTPHLFPKLSPSAFRTVGEAIRTAISFSYLYRCSSGKVLAPNYEQGGLKWAGLSDREFRSQYIGAYVSTSVAETGGAAQGTLHEIEFLRDQRSRLPAQAEPILLAGILWIKEGAQVHGKRIEVTDWTVLVDGSDIFQGLTLGGERNYGFGRVLNVPVPQTLKVDIFNLWPQADPDEAQLVNSRCLLGHLPYRPDLAFKGDVEIIAGREYPDQETISAFRRAGAHAEIENSYWFVPGTRLNALNGMGVPSVHLDSWGRLVWL